MSTGGRLVRVRVQPLHTQQTHIEPDYIQVQSEATADLSPAAQVMSFNKILAGCGQIGACEPGCWRRTLTHAGPQQEEGGRDFRKGPGRMNNVIADIFNAVSLMDPNQKFFKTDWAFMYSNKKQQGRMLLLFCNYYPAVTRAIIHS